MNKNSQAPKRKNCLKTTNAYFYWVTREQGSFDWFKGVMNEISELDQRVIHVCMLAIGFHGMAVNWEFQLF